MIDELIIKLKDIISSIDDIDEKISMINKVNIAINEVNPLKEPICNIQYIKSDYIHANEYNPNHVATPEMELLYNSIKLDGYTQPIVAYRINENEYEIVDGFHRNRVGKEHEDINKRLFNYLPLTIIDKPLDERMGSTIRHNRARGSHQIRSMSDIVLDLSKSGWTDDDISNKLGMEMDEVLRLKQITGLKEAFQNHEFSKSWEEFESKYYE